MSQSLSIQQKYKADRECPQDTSDRDCVLGTLSPYGINQNISRVALLWAQIHMMLCAPMNFYARVMTPDVYGDTVSPGVSPRVDPRAGAAG